MASGTRTLWLPAGAIVVAAGFWGLWWMPLRALAGLGLDGPSVNAALYLSICIVLLPWAWRRRRHFRAGGPMLLAAGGLFGAALVCWNTALIVGEVVRVTLLFYLAPVWASLLGRVVLGEPIGPARIAAVVLGLSGAAVLLGFEGGLPLPRGVGDWLALGAGVLFALSATVVRKDPSIDGREQTYATFLAAAVLALAIVALGPTMPWPGARALGAAALVALLWLLPSTWAIFWGARYLDPGRVSLLLLLEVVAAAASAALLTDEPFGAREAAGCALILSAGALEGLAALRRRRVTRPRLEVLPKG